MSTWDRLVARIRSLPPIAVDGALALAILPNGFLDLALSRQQDEPPPYHLNHWSFVAFALMCLPLAIRRRNMLLSYALIQGTTLIAILAHVQTDILGLPGFMLTTVLLFAVADGAQAWIAILASFAELAILLLAFEISQHGRPFADYLAGTTLYFPPWAFGLYVGWALRRRRILVERLEGRSDEIQLERERLASLAVAGERIRIAQELRILVSRGVERMIGQAHMARRDIGVRSKAATAELAAIEATGRRTLVEMRRLLLVLKTQEAQPAEFRRSDPSTPLPGGPPPPADQVEPFRRLGTIPRWLHRPSVADIALVVLLAGSIAARWRGQGGLFPGPLDAALTGVILGSLLVRSRLPFSAFCVIAIAEFVWILLEGGAFPDWSEEALLVSVYTVAAYKGRPWAVGAVGLATMSWIPLPFQHLCFCLLVIGTLAVLGAAGGAAMQAGRRLNAELEELGDQLLRTRDTRVRLALTQERTRVARDMHDVVAHGVTVMVIQAGGARMVAESDPSRAGEMLQDVERMGREAVRELGTLVGALDPGWRAVDDELSSETPNVGALVARLRRTGQAVHLTEEGGPLPRDQGIQLCLYRIVQEALTNVRKHAPGAAAKVEIRTLPGAIHVQVTNTAGIPAGAGTASSLLGSGHGLVGIRERVSLFGGEAEAGPLPDGGFRVAAALPLELVPA